MLKRLELDSLKADLSAVEALLTSRSEEDDPVGWFQFSARKQELVEDINRLAQTPELQAGVGLFFGGRPVFGSRGIHADFAGQALDKFQDLISKRFASLETGPLASRGPVPFRESARLMITDVARGSFGFLLEEASDTERMIDTPLKHVVEEVSELIFKLSSLDDEVFESAAETIDDRLLGTLKQFFLLLDDSGATLRIVEGEKEFLLDHDAVSRARLRAETMEIAEREDDKISGFLYLLPATRKFELHVLNSNDIVKGNISAECLKEVLGDSTEPPPDVIGKPWRTKMRIREVQERNRPSRVSYTLTKLVERIQPESAS